MDITKLSINRPRLIIVFYLLVVLLGIFGYSRLNYELVPQFTPPVITATTIYPGASPSEVEDKVSRVIEDAMSSVENIDLLTSISQESFSLVRLELKPGAEVDKILLDAQRKLSGVADQLPDGIEPPRLTRFDFNDLPVIRMGVYSDIPAEELFDLTRNQIQPALSRLQGVAQVRVLGGSEREVQVNINPADLEYNGLTILQIVQAVATSNLNIPIGNIDGDGSKSGLRLIGKFNDLEELGNVLINNPLRRSQVRLRDIADIQFVPKEQAVISRLNGRESLGIDIKKQGDANAVAMSELVRSELSQLEKRYEVINLRFDIAQDTSEFTLEAADAVIEDLTLAIILVSLVMLLFLHSLRNSLIVLISIPTSILATFIVMYVLGYSLNLLSLLGLSLAIGILVDDSIVVIENIYRHLEMRKSRALAAYEGRMEIGFTAISITLIDVVVFIPIILSTGMVADLLRQFSVVVLVSTLMSLLVSFTLVPLVASRIGKLERIRESAGIGKLIALFEKGIDQLAGGLSALLRWAISHRLVTLSVVLLLFLSSFLLILLGFIGIEFTKAGDRGEFIIELELDKNASIDRTSSVTSQVEDYLRQQPEVTSIFTTIGVTSSGRIEFNTSYLAELSIKLVDKSQRKSAAELARIFKLDLESAIPGLIVRPVEINILGLRGDDAVQFTIVGSDPDSLIHYAGLLEQILDDIEGTVEVQSTSGTPATENLIKVDRQQLDNYGLNLAQVGATLRTGINGNTDGKFSYSGLDYDINLRIDPNAAKTAQQVMGLTVLNSRGQLIPVSQVAAMIQEKAPQKLERTNRTNSVTLKAQVIGKPAGSISADFQQVVAQIRLPDSIGLIYGGQSKRTTDGLKTMGFAFAASILLVYFVLTILYNSFTYPFVVLLSIPLALIGAFLALALSMEALSIFSILGLVMLVGLVGKNAILVVDFAIRLIQGGMDTIEALLEATRLRFRPVLMTNLSMIIGLLPIALATGAGSEWKNGLAWALIGGLSSSMILTLIVVPVVFTFFTAKIAERTKSVALS